MYINTIQFIGEISWFFDNNKSNKMQGMNNIKVLDLNWKIVIHHIVIQTGRFNCTHPYNYIYTSNVQLHHPFGCISESYSSYFTVSQPLFLCNS